MKKFLKTLLLLLLPVTLIGQTPIVTSTTANSATIKWNSVPNISKYMVTWTSDTKLDSAAFVNDTTITLTGLTTNKTYKFNVGSVSGNELSFTTNPPTVNCGIANVALFGTYNKTATGFKADWADVSGATSYVIQIRKRNTTDPWIQTPTPISEFTFTNLIPSTNYEWQIQTLCNGGIGAFSPSGWTTTAAGTVTPPPIDTTTVPPVGNGTLPTFDRVIIVVEENHGYSQIVGSAQAPNFNALITDTSSALMTQSYALTHPSQPNYLMLFSGSNQGVTNDACPVGPFNTPNIFSQYGSMNKTYGAYSESLPSVGSTVCSSGGSGGYWRKHAPWVNFNNIDHSKELTTMPIDFASLPNLSFVVPNQTNDWHDGTLAQMDTWLATSGIMSLAQWAKTHNSLLIVTFDEDDGSTSNRIPTLFIGAKVKDGSYSQTINHYSVLRMLQDMQKITNTAGAVNATKIDFCWK